MVIEQNFSGKYDNIAKFSRGNLFDVSCMAVTQKWKWFQERTVYNGIWPVPFQSSEVYRE